MAVWWVKMAKDKPKAKAPEKRPNQRPGKSQAYDQKAMTGKRKTYCGG